MLLHRASDGYSLDATARRQIKDFNAKRLAVITGRSIDAENRNPSYDLVKDVRLARIKWLGHILRLDENIQDHQRPQSLHQRHPPRRHVHGRGTNSKEFEELVEIARERSRWRELKTSLRRKLLGAVQPGAHTRANRGGSALSPT